MQDETFTYAANGNLLTRSRIAGSYVYPAGNAIRPHAATAIGSASLTYNDNGNMVSDGSRTLAWDLSNLLSSVEQAGSKVTFA